MRNVEKGNHSVCSLEELLSYEPKIIGFYGGTFNYPHSGCLSIADAALSEFCDLVVFCPHPFDPEKSSTMAYMEAIHDLIDLGIDECAGKDNLFVSTPDFILGIQNNAFLKLVSDLKSAGVSSCVIIGADSITDKYPKYMRELCHLIAPRKGHKIDVDHILKGKYYVLTSVETHHLRHYKKNLVDHFRSESIDPKEMMKIHEENLSMLWLIAIACREAGKTKYAKKCLERILELENGSKLVSDVSEKLKNSNNLGETASIPDTVRYALFGLFLIASEERNYKLADECILDATYEATQPDILISAGHYYLHKSSAEVETALAYFIRACDIDPTNIQICDKDIRSFLENNRSSYAKCLLEPWINAWNNYIESFYT